MKTRSYFQRIRAASHPVSVHLYVYVHTYSHSHPFSVCFVRICFYYPCCCRLFSSSSSSLSFFLISRGTDNNDEAERIRTELYMTLLSWSWHAFIVRTCQKKEVMERKKNRREKEKRRKRARDSWVFSLFVFYCTQTNCM